MPDRGRRPARSTAEVRASRAPTADDHDTDAAPVALVTYSTRPRGGVVHTLHLAEALTARGQQVRVFALGDPDVGFFRPVAAPVTIIPAPPPRPTLEERVFAAIQALTRGLADRLHGFGLVHTQDCIAARAAAYLRDAAMPIQVLRTVHHIDDFTTEALINCQRRSILDPDHLLVVSRFWRDQLATEFDVDAHVVTNGVDAERFAARSEAVAASLRSSVGADGAPLFLTVGGIEPRKGSRELVEALAIVHDHLAPPPTLVVVGGHSFQDHRQYRRDVLARARELSLDDRIRLVGTVSDRELADWYHAADAFVFPSVKEGFGLVLLEAMAAGLPVVASDIPVFREFVRDGVDALLAPAGKAAELAAVMVRLATDPALRATLGAAGPRLAAQFTWDRCARQHQRIYHTVSVRGDGGQRASASS